MPTMPRQKGPGRKIAFKILGKPANLAFKPSKSTKKINKALVFEETARVR